MEDFTIALQKQNLKVGWEAGDRGQDLGHISRRTRVPTLTPCTPFRDTASVETNQVPKGCAKVLKCKTPLTMFITLPCLQA